MTVFEEKKDTRKRKKPPTKLKSSGVHTFKLGEPDSPITLALAAYCTQNKKTNSEAIRDAIIFSLLKRGLIENPTEKDFTKLSPSQFKLTEKGQEYTRTALEKLKNQENNKGDL